MRAAVGGLQALAVVCDCERQYVLLLTQTNPHLRSLGMLGDVGERFLCDAVQTGAQGIGQIVWQGFNEGVALGATVLLPASAKFIQAFF